MPKRVTQLKTAMEDPVKDQRELAKNFLSSPQQSVLEEKEIDVLDICCGTGRWMQAFNDIVLNTESTAMPNVDFLDLCSNSLEVLRQRIPQMHNVRGGVVINQCATKISQMHKKYDLITNCHGFQGIPKSVIGPIIKEHCENLKPDGVAMIALADKNSFQSVTDQFFPEPQTKAEDLRESLSSQGIRWTEQTLSQTQDFFNDGVSLRE